MLGLGADRVRSIPYIVRADLQFSRSKHPNSTSVLVLWCKSPLNTTDDSDEDSASTSDIEHRDIAVVIVY